VKLSALLLALLLAGPASAQPSVTPGDQRILVKGMVMRPAGPIAGEVLVEGDEIKCADAHCPAAGATVIDTRGIIFPGLLDAHNHAAFGMFDEADWNPGPIFKNHNSWPRTDKRYAEVLRAKKYLEATAGLACEMDKYGEVKALIAGTTSLVLAPKGSARACYGSLVRTIDTQFDDLLGKDFIQAAISVPGKKAAPGICRALGSGKTRRYLVHVGEGIDGTSRNEFATLASRGGGCLLRAQTTIIHGTAFEADDFQKMADHDMGLVWSPKSNEFLYKRDDGRPATADIGLAIARGVKTIALGPDWALGGSVNLLEELRFARTVAADAGWTAVTPERLFRMVTSDAARALGVDDLLGSLEVRKRADLMVVAATGDPYAALLGATPKNVRLVMVNGKVLYGDQALSAAASLPGCESFDACGAPKFLCVAEADGTTDKRKQTLREITGALETALTRHDRDLPQGRRFMPLAPLTSCAP
jgi:5-methylthioadenosine/S-adenosylhomocysteine deaminase